MNIHCVRDDGLKKYTVVVSKEGKQPIEMYVTDKVLADDAYSAAVFEGFLKHLAEWSK